MARRYRLKWAINDVSEYKRRFKVDPPAMTGDLCRGGTFTHAEACTFLRKITRQKWRRDYLEEIGR